MDGWSLNIFPINSTLTWFSPSLFSCLLQFETWTTPKTTLFITPTLQTPFPALLHISVEEPETEMCFKFILKSILKYLFSCIWNISHWRNWNYDCFWSFWLTKQRERKKKKGEDYEYMSHRFPIESLGKPYIYQNLGDFTRIGDFYLEGVWLWRIVEPPDCRDADLWSSNHAQTRLTFLCIDG